MSVRTPEETARLALTVSVNGPEGPVVLAAMARKTFAEALDWSGRWAPAVALAYCAADLAEARAENATLREQLAEEKVLREVNYSIARDRYFRIEQLEAELAALRNEVATVVRQAVEASGYRYADGEGAEVVAWHHVLDHLLVMRGNVKLLAEWQAVRLEELATPAPPDGDRSAWIQSLQKTSSVEARMLEMDLAEARAEAATLKAEVESLAAATFAGVREKQAARIATLERELAAMRPKAEAAERNCEAMANVLRTYWPVNRRPRELERLLACYAPTCKDSLQVAAQQPRPKNAVGIIRRERDGYRAWVAVGGDEVAIGDARPDPAGAVYLAHAALALFRAAGAETGLVRLAEEPRQVVEPAPATVRWRCEGCKRSVPGYRVRGGPPTEHWHWNEGDSMAMYTCGPCVPAADAQPAGAADGEAG